MRLIPIITFALTSIACSSGAGKGDGSDSGDAYGEFGTDPDSGNPDAPVLEWATVTMRGGTCFIEGGYTDPQGPADVRRGTVTAVDPDSGEVLWTDDLFVCVDYGCVGSFADHAAYRDAPCSAASRFEFRGFLYDRSGNESNTQLLEQ